MKVVWVVHVIA